MLSKVVCLIGDEQHRLLSLTQDLRHLIVKVCDAVQYIHDEEDDVGLLDSDTYLAIDLLLEDIIAAHHPASGIHYRERSLTPHSMSILPVASSAGLLRDDGTASTSQTVEEGTLAHIGATHDSY